MVCDLALRECEPCRGGVPPLKGRELRELHEQLNNGWSIVDDHHLSKEFRFPDFRSALDFTVKVGELAEQVGHHPDIHLSWGRVLVEVWTHKIDGLHEADFVFAAKVDALTTPA